MKPSIRHPRPVRRKSRPRVTFRCLNEVMKWARKSVDLKSRHPADEKSVNWKQGIKDAISERATTQQIIARSAEEARRFQLERLSPSTPQSPNP
mgnify:FL=1